MITPQKALSKAYVEKRNRYWHLILYRVLKQLNDYPSPSFEIDYPNEYWQNGDRDINLIKELVDNKLTPLMLKSGWLVKSKIIENKYSYKLRTEINVAFTADPNYKSTWRDKLYLWWINLWNK